VVVVPHTCGIRSSSIGSNGENGLLVVGGGDLGEAGGYFLGL
jgi:hypothetical protein